MRERGKLKSDRIVDWGSTYSLSLEERNKIISFLHPHNCSCNKKSDYFINEITKILNQHSSWKNLENMPNASNIRAHLNNILKKGDAFKTAIDKAGTSIFDVLADIEISNEKIDLDDLKFQFQKITSDYLKEIESKITFIVEKTERYSQKLGLARIIHKEAYSKAKKLNAKGRTICTSKNQLTIKLLTLINENICKEIIDSKKQRTISEIVFICYKKVGIYELKSTLSVKLKKHFKDFYHVTY